MTQKQRWTEPLQGHRGDRPIDSLAPRHDRPLTGSLRPEGATGRLQRQRPIGQTEWERQNAAAVRWNRQWEQDRDRLAARVTGDSRQDSQITDGFTTVSIADDLFPPGTRVGQRQFLGKRSYRWDGRSWALQRS